MTAGSNYKHPDVSLGSLEEMSVHRASQMRFVQVLGILLALINFAAFIVIKFLRGLARSDRVADLARKETDQILGSVREGLFLLERNGAVGRQQSKSTANLLTAANCRPAIALTPI